jgi:hypothetical protein
MVNATTIPLFKIVSFKEGSLLGFLKEQHACSGLLIGNRLQAKNQNRLSFESERSTQSRIWDIASCC